MPKPPVKPAGATIVQPVTPEEQAATEATLGWMSGLVDYGYVMFERALVAKNDCEQR